MFTLFLYVLVAIGFLLGALILSYAAFVSRKRQRWSHIPSPPMPSFFKGHADEFLWIREQDLPVGQLFLEWCMQYGKILVVWFWHNPVLLVADSDAIKAPVAGTVRKLQSCSRSGLQKSLREPGNSIWYKKKDGGC